MIELETLPPFERAKLVRKWIKLGKPRISINAGVTVFGLGKYLRAPENSEHLAIVIRFINTEFAKRPPDDF